jgi:hypothetical protein
MRPTTFAHLLSILALLAGVHAVAQTPRVDLDGPPAKRLSDYGFFKGTGATQEPVNGVVPYDVATPLFSDYTAKHRFVWLPPGAPARYDEREIFDFPLGTVLIKTF